MSSSKEQASISQVMCFLHEWDQGSKTVRSRMLSDFLAKNTGKMCLELELEFAQVASLFLARLTAWIRLTYGHALSICALKYLIPSEYLTIKL
uniref:Uncharacterized protein n=1 Tax=Sinocyclocheilus anshuiensis TaxID=1608454 RepID=A0A671QDZ2_9TELE